ncbi:MAG: 4Fe-4S dicluster domain-containing protein, partial [Paracoccus sp. (in: a-proteobacteria)]
FGGFAREQICVYACPWPRIQAAMMDEDTLTVAYRDWRGEPRGKGTGAGDCIDCLACVNVCPMGIDIRDGQQLECITCALCIDACDQMMERTGRPKGLIGYLALSDETAERAGAAPCPVWRHVLRPRTILYTVMWSGIGVLIVLALLMRSQVDMNVTPVRNPLFVTLSDGTIRNAYELRLRNKQHDDVTYELGVDAAGPLALTVEGEEGRRLTVPADQTMTRRVYLSAPPQSPLAMSETTPIRLTARDPAGAAADVETVFHGKDAQ